MISPDCLACGNVKVDDEWEPVCYGCAGNKVVNSDGQCEQPNIPNCDVIDSDNGHKCLKCNAFYSPNPARTACIACEGDNIPDGCLSCHIDRLNQTTTCTACIGNLYLSNGECLWDECESFNVANRNGKLMEARCDECEEGYGLNVITRTCVECSGNGDWTDCIDCTIDSFGVPANCTQCDANMVIHSDPASIP